MPKKDFLNNQQKSTLRNEKSQNKVLGEIFIRDSEQEHYEPACNAIQKFVQKISYKKLYEKFKRPDQETQNDSVDAP